MPKDPFDHKHWEKGYEDGYAGGDFDSEYVDCTWYREGFVTGARDRTMFAQDTLRMQCERAGHIKAKGSS